MKGIAEALEEFAVLDRRAERRRKNVATMRRVIDRIEAVAAEHPELGESIIEAHVKYDTYVCMEWAAPNFRMHVTLGKYEEDCSWWFQSDQRWHVRCPMRTLTTRKIKQILSEVQS